MALMNAVCVIETEYTAFVRSGQMRQKEGKIVSNDLILSVDPNLFTEDADPTGTTGNEFHSRCLCAVSLSDHINSVA